MRHILVQGMGLELLQEKQGNLKGLEWHGALPTSYSVHIFENSANDGGIIALSDSFGGLVSWARFKGANSIRGGEQKLDIDEAEFLTRRYPEFLHAIHSLA